eukprot:scaffold130343_cov26-Tisochrysis_lutea.AAC.2
MRRCIAFETNCQQGHISSDAWKWQPQCSGEALGYHACCILPRDRGMYHQIFCSCALRPYSVQITGGVLESQVTHGSVLGEIGAGERDRCACTEQQRLRIRRVERNHCAGIHACKLETRLRARSAER